MLTNAEIAGKLTGFAQLLSIEATNRYKVKAYRRAAKTIQALGESIDELVRNNSDLTAYPGIGKAISGALREIVETGTLRQMEILQAQVPPELGAIADYPRLDPARVLRIYRALGISSVEALKERLESGEIAGRLGGRMAHHVRQALNAAARVLLYEADHIAASIDTFLLEYCGVDRVEPAGDYRRRTEVVGEIAFLIETANFSAVLARLERFGGKADILHSTDRSILLRHPAGILLRVETASQNAWGLRWIEATGSESHFVKLESQAEPLPALSEEAAVYNHAGLGFIPPELREGNDEIELAARGAVPELISVRDIRGELHAHTVSSDGTATIAQMRDAARQRGYEYLGISDHSRSLKIAGGLSEEDLWAQIRFLDKINENDSGFKILKSAEVDILGDGTLDYPNELLRELDYTVCSIHSRFSLNKAQQTERILRAMDNRYFNLLGHATGRLLLKRPGYEIDLERVVSHARANGCGFEINSSPDRLDLSAENARLARDAGIKIAINTDAHSIRDFDLVRYGIGQARRAGLAKSSILNAMPWSELQKVFRR